MDTFIAVASFSPETDLPRMMTVRAEEIAKVAELRQAGRLGAVHPSPTRGRVFLEVRAESEDAAMGTIRELPMAQWWDIELFPTMTPTGEEQPPH